MIQCSECDESLYPGTLYCTNCGASVVSIKNEVAVLEEPVEVEPPNLVGQNFDSLSGKRDVILMIPFSGRYVSYPVQQHIRVGRASATSSMQPELNLQDDAGIEHGVSRHHALVRPDDRGRGLVLLDLGSTNGTKLNNYRLPPNLPYPLKSGDEIQFGSLLVHVFLK